MRLLPLILLIPALSTHANIFTFENISECRKMEDKLWNCVPESADIILEDDTYIREASPDLIECKAGKCLTYEGIDAGKSSQDGKYYVLGGWQLINNGKYAAYPSSLPPDPNDFFTPTYPSIVQQGKEPRDFIPWGWRVLSSASGDLNNDGKLDWAFILQGDDLRFRTNELDANPRLLFVLLSNSDNGLYKVVQNNEFIPSHNDTNMFDPFFGMTISDNELHLNFGVELSAGSWTNSNKDYVFEYQNNQMLLNEYTYNEVHRGSGEMLTEIVNFKKAIKETRTGTISSDEEKVVSTPLNNPAPIDINSIFFNALEFNVPFS